VEPLHAGKKSDTILMPCMTRPISSFQLMVRVSHYSQRVCSEFSRASRQVELFDFFRPSLCAPIDPSGHIRRSLLAENGHRLRKASSYRPKSQSASIQYINELSSAIQSNCQISLVHRFVAELVHRSIAKGQCFDVSALQ